MEFKYNIYQWNKKNGDEMSQKMNFALNYQFGSDLPQWISPASAQTEKKLLPNTKIKIFKQLWKRDQEKMHGLVLRTDHLEKKYNIMVK